MTERDTWPGPIFIHLFCVLLIGAFLFQPVADADFYGHLRYGAHIIDGHGLTMSVDPPRTNHFSYTVPDAEWIDHEWLYQVLLRAIHLSTGEIGLALYQLLAALLMGTILYLSQLREHGNGLLVMAGLLLPLLGLRNGFGLRPQIVTYIGTGIVLYLATDSPGTKGWKWWLIPVLFVPWASMHGGFVAGLAVLWCLVLYHLLRSDRPTRTRFFFLVVAAVSTLVTLINPYGPELWQLVLNATTDPFTRRFIEDWRPLYSRPWLVWVWLGLIGQGLFWWFQQRTPLKSWYLLPVGLTIIMAAVSVRNLPLAAVSVGCLCPFPADRQAGDGDLWPSVGAGLGSLLIVAWLIVRVPSGLIVPKGSTPDRLTEPLEVTGGTHRVFVHYNWSQWLLFHHPRVRVYFDGRYDTAYPRRIIHRYVRVVRGEVELLNESATRWVLVPHWYPLNEALNEEPNWRRVKRTRDGQLWKRTPREQSNQLSSDR
jgi:hypothetical protein